MFVLGGGCSFGLGFGRFRLRWGGPNGHLTSPNPSFFFLFFFRFFFQKKGNCPAILEDVGLFSPKIPFMKCSFTCCFFSSSSSSYPSSSPLFPSNLSYVSLSLILSQCLFKHFLLFLSQSVFLHVLVSFMLSCFSFFESKSLPQTSPC